MVLLNFSHPLTDPQRVKLTAMLDVPIDDVHNHPAHFDVARSFADQAAALVDAVGLTPEQWQTEAIVVNPPSLAVIAVTVLAELHGRMGYFPAVVRIRPIAGSTPPVYEVAEIINLQAVRDAGRERRIS
ncbi:conserved protein of unknown function [Candidatus Promineifilum breve]|uniref:Uncharacterized protein n=1 Tax=Candidatus Promineifilum breve TaxID=1806508 RepID=A0A160T832_9CHLR|nr:CRISPR-associated protein Csx15 [Candidatus Promineifilum breve]CUS05070.2 conserved protein of unknown function [Candidatus Promineifilum breve]